MGSLFSKNMGVSSEPASADVSGLARSIAQGKALEAEGTAAAIKILGGSIWGAYKGQQEIDVEGKLKASMDEFTKPYEELSKADTANKAMVESEMYRAKNAQQDYFNAAILAGTDQETAANRAVQVSNKPENSVLAAFRETQQKIMTARDAMPERQHEMMIRSEKILKQYIAKIPGMANNFRQIAQEVTGKQGLDLYSVNRLYEDVNFIERQTANRAKQQEAVDAQNKTLFINDLKQNGESEYNASLAYNNLDVESRLKHANAAAYAVKHKDDAANALKAGGANLTNFTNATIAGIETDLLRYQGVILTEYNKLGITKAQILAPATINPRIANSEAYKKLVESATSGTLGLLDKAYGVANTQIAESIASGKVDAAAGRQARLDLTTWYEGNRKFYSENATALTLAFASEGTSITDSQKQITLMKTFSESLGITPDLVLLYTSGDPKKAAAAAATNPLQAQQVLFIQEITSEAMRGISNERFNELRAKVMDMKKTGGSSNAPVTKIEAAAQLLDIQSAATTLASKINKNEPITSNELREIIRSGMANQGNADFFDKQIRKNFDIALAKLPEAERKETITLINSAAKTSLYGFNQYGDIAKKSADEFKANFFNLAPTVKGLAENPKVFFKDTTGLSALKMVVEAPMKAGLSEADQNRYKVSETDILNARPDNIDNRLAHVDTILRMQSQATGVLISDLRKEFIATFNKEGLPSSTYTAPLIRAGVAEALDAQIKTVTDITAQIDKIVKAPEKAVAVVETPVAAAVAVPAEAAVVDEKFAGQSGFIRDDAAMEERRKTIVVEKGKVVAEEEKSNTPVQYANPPPINNVPTSRGKRLDGTFKGEGYFGEILNKKNEEMTEFSVRVTVDDKDYLIPLLVPTLSSNQLKRIVDLDTTKPIPKDLVEMAVAHAMPRIKNNKSPFAEKGEMVDLPSGFRAGSSAMSGKVQPYKKEEPKKQEVKKETKKEEVKKENKVDKYAADKALIEKLQKADRKRNPEYWAKKDKEEAEAKRNQSAKGSNSGSSNGNSILQGLK